MDKICKRNQEEAVVLSYNQRTIREVVSPFMTTAVAILQDKDPKLQLNAETSLRENFNQGAPQNIAQLHSVAEGTEKKRKISQTDFDEDEKDRSSIKIYGIITNGKSGCSFVGLTHPRIEIMPTYLCPSLMVI
ncbi:8294_t:CDS:2 [Paraglomus brasilianum]|uniref:8294_t:CDS:1 n=1 Tax=Paraglomus brasilianum TaxID=144538 RepID=A0A9N9AXB7_9GLOM|nr:8294_t:CDS:2 [Paraglomus brasilianum]